MQQTEIDSAPPAPSQESFTGRSVFLVETTAAGISVQTALLTHESQLLRTPAVFPDLEYAFNQIDELKRLVSRHFSEAARLGAQVLAAQHAQQLTPSNTGPESMSSASLAKAEPEAESASRSAKAKKSPAR